jgi:exonuclease V
MKKGSAIHKTMEDQIHTTVPVEVSTREDTWGLRFWNVIQGLRTLRETGLTRELEIWGLIDGEVVSGIIDELGHDCPNPELEATASKHYANTQADMEALPEYQRSITDYLIDPSGKRLANLGPSPSTPNRKVYITDLKTRTFPSLPSLPSFRPTQMQLLLYHHILSTMTNPSTAIPLSTLADRYSFSPDTPFTDSFIAQVGSLNDIISSQIDIDLPSTQQSFSSQDSLALLTSHPTPASLYTLLLTQFRTTFPHGAASVSPVLTASYRLSAKSSKEADTSDFIGVKSFLFNRRILDSYVGDEMRWWRGERETKGVDIDEAWKCQGCEFKDECVWVTKRQDELLEMKRAKKQSGRSTV